MLNFVTLHNAFVCISASDLNCVHHYHCEFTTRLNILKADQRHLIKSFLNCLSFLFLVIQTERYPYLTTHHCLHFEVTIFKIYYHINCLWMCIVRQLCMSLQSSRTSHFESTYSFLFIALFSLNFLSFFLRELVVRTRPPLSIVIIATWIMARYKKLYKPMGLGKESLSLSFVSRATTTPICTSTSWTGIFVVHLLIRPIMVSSLRVPS